MTASVEVTSVVDERQTWQRAYTYRKIGYLEHFMHTIGLSLFTAFGVVLWLFADVEITDKIIACCFFLIIQFLWYNVLRRYRMLPTYQLDELGVTQFSPEGKTFKRWDELVSVRSSRKIQERIGDMPGFLIKIDEETTWPVYQVIDGYELFYQALQAHKITGSERDILKVEKLDRYGRER
ncbi:MAG: hypothetical protein AAGB12_16815 [Pseudomonadota bacterium]